MIVCGVDGCADAARAALVASDLAARLDTPLLLLHVAPSPFVPERVVNRNERIAEEEEFERVGYIATVLDPIEVNPAVSVLRVVEFGRPVDVLRSVAAEASATHIVVGTRGQGAVEDILVASTSGALARDAPCPVILVPPDAHEWVDDRADPAIVCGFDDSDVSLGAVRAAGELTRRLDGRLVLAHVDEDAAMDGLAGDAVDRARAAAAGVAVEIEGLHGRASQELLALRRRAGAALLAVGSRGRGPLTAALLGSVSRELVQQAEVPVMVVSAAAARQASVRDALSP